MGAYKLHNVNKQLRLSSLATENLGRAKVMLEDKYRRITCRNPPLLSYGVIEPGISHTLATIVSQICFAPIRRRWRLMASHRQRFPAVFPPRNSFCSVKLRKVGYRITRSRDKKEGLLFGWSDFLRGKLICSTIDQNIGYSLSNAHLLHLLLCFDHHGHVPRY